ncbi:MAG: hypothetical protein NTZ30_19375 [Planctomycetota bacterium]|nr:hypothetical protein [Planctomycetota bacterium]
MSELNTAETSDESSFSLRMKLSVAALLLLLLGGVGYSSYSYIKNAPMREFDIAVAGIDIEKIADMEAEAFFETMKTIRDKMSDAQKKINDEKNMLRMNEQFKEKFNRFFGSSPEEQRAALDKDIDRMAGMMKGFMSGKGGFGGPGAGGPGGGGAGFKPADNAAKKTATPNGANTANANGAGGNAANAGGANTANGSNTANANGAGGANTANANGANGTNTANANGTGGPNVKGKGVPTPEERNKRLSDGLDKSTPEMRAQMTEYWVRMNQRVKERGVQMIPFLGGFGGPKPK